MNLPTPRPEERRRGLADGPAWADTLPACFRSEAFAEDLVPAETPSAAARRPARATWRWRDAVRALVPYPSGT